MIEHQGNKKRTGSFYTPSFVVDFMIERVFNYLTEENKLITNTYNYFQKSLGELYFCDPSLGTGNFVIGILKRVWNELKKFKDIKQDEKNTFFKNFSESNIYGIELKPDVLDECKERISFFFPMLSSNSFANMYVGNSIVNNDSFQVLPSEEAQQLNPLDWKKTFHPRNSFDVIIGNPPYYNLKKMELLDKNANLLFKYLKQSKTWKQFFRSSSDIYYYFILQSLNYLSNDGLLSFIIPNYWVENKYGDILREQIVKNQILEFLDLSNLNIFKDNGKWLNVSTCITTIQKCFPTRNVKVVKNIPKTILENHKRRKSTIDKLFFEIDQANLGKEKWVLSPHLKLLKQIEDKGKCIKLEQLAQVSQGLSPGVKEIFVMTKSNSERLSLEKEALVPFLTNKDVREWIVNNENLKIAILPSKIDDLENFPNIRQYLEQNKRKLEQGPDRQRLIKSNKIRWFDFSVYRNLKIFMNHQTKIMVPYRSIHPRFGIDENGSFGATDIYVIIPKLEEDFYFLLGILNSDLMNFWYSEAGKRKGKMLEFFSDPLKKIPIPGTEEKDILIYLVKEILHKIKNSKKQDYEVKEIKNKINQEVAKLYGVDYSLIASKLVTSSDI